MDDGQIAPRRLGLRRRRWIVDLGLTATLAALFVLEPRSIRLHSLLGLAFAALAGAHLWHRRRWIASTVRRLLRRQKLRRRDRWAAPQSVALWVLGVVATVSGVWDWTVAPTRIRIHALSSVAFTVIVVRHAWTRRRGLLPPRTGASHVDVA